MWLVIVVLVIVALVAVVVVQGQKAGATTSLSTQQNQQAATATVRKVFSGFRSRNWHDCAGPGQLNYVSKTPGGGTVTMSIDVEAATGGATVSMWASQMSTQYGLPKGGGAVNAMKKAVAKKLARG
jgi:hypothetical protein